MHVVAILFGFFAFACSGQRFQIPRKLVKDRTYTARTHSLSEEHAQTVTIRVSEPQQHERADISKSLKALASLAFVTRPTRHVPMGNIADLRANLAMRSGGTGHPGGFQPTTSWGTKLSRLIVGIGAVNRSSTGTKSRENASLLVGLPAVDLEGTFPRVSQPSMQVIARQPLFLPSFGDQLRELHRSFTLGVPKWMMSLREEVLDAVSNFGTSMVDTRSFDCRLVHVSMERIEVRNVAALSFGYTRTKDTISLEIYEITLDARVYLKRLRLFGFIPILLNKVNGDAFVDVGVHGYIRASFRKQANGTWAPDAHLDLKGIGVTKPVRFGVNKPLNFLDRLVPAFFPAIKGVLCDQIKRALRAFAGTFSIVFSLQDTFTLAPANLDMECGDANACGDGTCKFCGIGLCCRLGYRKGECDGHVGGARSHQCALHPWDKLLRTSSGYEQPNKRESHQRYGKHGNQMLKELHQQ